jgi:predicted anti-sigma-YlaC factor YlaD
MFLHCFKLLCVVAYGHLSHYGQVPPQLSVYVYTTLDNCVRCRCLYQYAASLLTYVFDSICSNYIPL